MNKILLILSPLLIVTKFSAQKKPNQFELGGSLNPITTAVPFLMISPDSKQGAMGDVGAATDPDVNANFWNPSKLAFTDKKFGIGLTATPWLRRLVPDIWLYYVSGYVKLNKNQTIGASMRYFSLGEIQLTDNTGFNFQDYTPNEFSMDVCFAQKLSKNFSLAVSARFINSGISKAYTAGGTAGNAASTGAADVSMYYQSDKFSLGDKKAIASGGLAITNIGAKIKYSNDQNFIPINMRLGGGLKTDIDKYNKVGVYLDFNKLLVPTPPIYKYKVVNGRETKDKEIDPATGDAVILAGKKPNVDVATGILQSFNDAPGGFKEELREINISGGLEYVYDDMLAIRGGYFYENKNKGGRQFFTAGVGFKLKVITIDASYLIPTTLNNPLQNTWRISLSFLFDPAKKEETPAGAVQP